jgi:GGDEF domain-containing protein
MTGQPTAKSPHMTEQQKARARLILLTLIGVICAPLAGARSVSVWILYVAFLILYSLWCLRLARSFAGDRRLGYVLCLTDTATILPLLVWSSSVSLKAVLLVTCVGGLAVTYWVDRTRVASDARTGTGSRSLWSVAQDRSEGDRTEVPLERALRVRLRVFEATRARFALVVLRVARFEEMNAYYGEDAADRLLAAVSRRGLRLLGHDAQQFFLPGGRVAFVFATGRESARSVVGGESPAMTVDPYDVESVAMTLARKACEHLVDGHRVECVVGWAAAPSDGISADDLMYAAESGAQSTAAFRRVAGSRVPVPEKTRAAAG